MVHQTCLGGTIRAVLGGSLAGLLVALSVAGAHAQPVPAPAGENPFSALFGEWTLKDDKFQYVGDGRTVETQIIPNHHTQCARVNTDRSMLCVVKAGALNGHMLWTYDASKQRVHWLSHFGTERTGVGVGTFDKASNLTFKVSFTDEPEGSYRQYRYEWVSPDEYTLRSTQYDRRGRATGNWYGGAFVRLPASALAVAGPTRPPATGMAYSVEDDIQKVKAILKKIDADITDTSIYSEDVVHMAQGSRAITSKAALQKVLAAEASHGRSNMTHEIVTLHSYSDLVLTRGRVKGAWHPANGGSPIPFETNNIITFRRAADGSLKVWHVIFNWVELERYQP
ncbi:Cif family virulence factor [Caulobacter segnis]|uniref:DUF4440 domain-containing protein n=2 Tax=Caulobacter segnis TaxID=88688 RepID=D5VES4_CAUST|nr:hypothetical protein [Caulobacter segnis]ADG09217.1 hypothetical protein Cseg_0710 [Caulobacter segnis ATCC 21756]